MTDEEARGWLAQRFGASAFARLQAFERLLIDASQGQNLVSRASLATLWSRHIADSAQLLDHARGEGRWVDVGTGGGFPGLVVALLADRPVTMIEPRRLRVSFLQGVVDHFELRHAEVVQAKVEAVDRKAAVISARAVASIDALITMTFHLSTPNTRWLLPRGGYDPSQAIVRAGGVMFHVEHSLTDADSTIVIGDRA